MKYLVKICGITSEKDVKAAQQLGANFIGFVLVQKSKRFVDLKKLESLSMMISKSSRSVALLADPSDDFLERLLMTCKVDYIQLHGEESPKRVDEIASLTKTPLIKAIGIEKASDLLKVRSYEQFVEYILLDSKVKEVGGLTGGRGVTFDWKIIEGFYFNKPWFLAGGININNVIDALRISGTKMLDVSTGVEHEPGKKSFQKIKEFIGKVNGEFI